MPLPTLRLPPHGSRRTARGETWFGYSFVPGDLHPLPSASSPGAPDPRGLAADITNLGLWGNGDVQLEVDNARQIAYAMELVRQAFAAKQTDSAKGSDGQSRHVCG